MRRKKCFIPGCKNNSYNNSSKFFLKISLKVAPKWCACLGIPFNPKTDHYCCEDHVKLEDAVEDYSLWIKQGGKLKLNKKYQPYFLKENIPIAQSQIYSTQEGQEAPILKLLLLTEEPHRSKISPLKASSIVNLPPVTNKPATYIPTKVQVGIQCKPQYKHKMANYRCKNITYGAIKKQKLNPETVSSPIISDCESDYQLPSISGSTTEIEESTSMLSTDTSLRSSLLSLIEKYPKIYIGVPKSFYWILDYIATETSTDKLKIIMVLYKIKQNDSNRKICHLFQTNPFHFSRIFPSIIKILANFFQNQIFLPDSKIIKTNLPLAFKIRFSKVQCILDCFEIQIERPSDPVSQSQTWSQYKGCNTAKYLVGCTPDGFVCYISSGYGGRCSDKMFVEICDLLDILPENCVFMADRGFKAVEASFSIKNIKLLRPPSVYSGIKPDKSEVVLTKVIASLRVHVERLIRRLWEFRFLKPHAVVKYQHLAYLDYIVIIACGLINLQNKLIKD